LLGQKKSGHNNDVAVLTVWPYGKVHIGKICKSYRINKTTFKDEQKA